MAILSTIRDKSLFLILIIGMALFAFVASPDQIMNFFQSDKVNFVGSVNGEQISREEFVNQVKNYKAGNNNMNDSQASKAVWNNLMQEKIYETQLKKAGIVVGEKDIWEFLINDNSIKSNPQFQNEAGLFDEERLKAFIADLQADKTENGKTRWQSWLDYERSIKQSLERDAYLNLVKSGIDVSLDEGKRNYELNNTMVSGKYVFLPFQSIPDSTVNVTDSDIQAYINEHKKDFQVEASRSLRYVKFDLVASEEDKNQIKESLMSLIDDREEYSSVAKANIKIEGLQNTTDYQTFLAENSDTPFNDNYVFKSDLSTQLADSLFSLPVNSIYGPYEDGEYIKLSKIIENTEVPSVMASHILIAYEGAMRANPDVKRTKEEAEARAEEILSRVKRSNSDFATEAKLSSDGPSATKGGDLGWFKEGQMVPAFNDWVFSHKKGDIGLVETDFGYHIIKVFDTKSDPAIKLASVTKLIAPSETTENKVFVEAESFAAELSKGADFTELSKEKSYEVKNAQKLKKQDDRIPGLAGNNANIVYWTFEDNVSVGDSKRFDIDKAYVVAQLTEKEAKGLQSVKSAKTLVKPIIIKEKKAKMLSDKMKDGDLSSIADANEVRVLTTGEISYNNPSTAVGREKAVAGAMLAMNEGDIVRGVVGNNGVYAIELLSKKVPAEMESYEPFREQLSKNLRKDNTTIFNALKEASEVEDYRY